MNIPGAFSRIDVTFDKNVETVLPLESTAGFAVLDFGVLPKGGNTPTGLANDATAYTASIDVDAPGGAVSVSVTGSAAQTFTALVTELNTDLGGAATAALVGGTIVITSATTGLASAVVVTDTDLFASVKGVDYFLKSNKSTKGAISYLKWADLDEGEKAELAAAMNTIDAADVEWVHAADSVRVSGVGVSPFAAVGITAGTYQLTVTVDGVGKQVAFAVGANDSFATVLNSTLLPALKAQWSQLTAYLTQVDATTLDLVIETTVPGNVATAAPTVTAGGAADFIAAVDGTAAWACAVRPAVAGVNGSSSLDVTGASPGVTYMISDAAVAASDNAITTNGTYYFKVSVDGAAAVEYNVVIGGATTYTALATALDTALNAAGVDVTFNDAMNAFVFTRTASGATSSVAISAGTTGVDVFARVILDDDPTTFTQVAYPGLADASWKSRLTAAVGSKGQSLLASLGTEAFLRKENKPMSKGQAVNTYVYHDGTNWKFFDTDVTVSAT